VEGRLFIRGCAIWREGAVEDARSVVIEGESIAAIDAEGALKALPGDWVCEARGRLLTPGLCFSASSTGSVARDRLLVANMLRRGATRVVMAAAPEVAALGARMVEVEGSPGRIAPSAPADVVLWDIVPSARFNPGELAVAFAAWVIVAGRVVVREGQLVGADYVSLAAAAR
jgi:imidazolonepropionase-like amidohydrolase